MILTAVPSSRGGPREGLKAALLPIPIASLQVGLAFAFPHDKIVRLQLGIGMRRPFLSTLSVERSLPHILARSAARIQPTA